MPARDREVRERGPMTVYLRNPEVPIPLDLGGRSAEVSSNLSVIQWIRSSRAHTRSESTAYIEQMCYSDYDIQGLPSEFAKRPNTRLFDDGSRSPAGEFSRDIVAPSELTTYQQKSSSKVSPLPKRADYRFH